jgi:hypothetical protein
MSIYSTDSNEHKINIGEKSAQDEVPDWYFEDPIFFDEEYKAMSDLQINEDEHEKMLRTMGVFN